MKELLFISGIGNKKTPLHFLVIHGTIKVRNPPELRLEGVRDWFESTDSPGHVEGIVWHCSSGVLYKVCRLLRFCHSLGHHLSTCFDYCIQCIYLEV